MSEKPTTEPTVAEMKQDLRELQRLREFWQNNRDFPEAAEISLRIIAWFEGYIKTRLKSHAETQEKREN